MKSAMMSINANITVAERAQGSCAKSAHPRTKGGITKTVKWNPPRQGRITSIILNIFSYVGNFTANVTSIGGIIPNIPEKNSKNPT